MGLAPSWLDGGLSLSQQRWVSACILARTNYFGQPIEISMRADNSNFSALQTTADEQKDFTIFEGGFFGNIFLEQPVGYACQGDDVGISDEILNWRICAKPSIKNPKFTMCDFILVGKCRDQKSFKIDQEQYQEIIKTYLKPGLTSLQKKPN